MKIIFLILSAGLVIQAEKFGIRGRQLVSDEAGIRGSRRGKQAGGIFGKKIWKQDKVDPKCHPSRSNCRELQKGRVVLFEFHLKFWNTASIGIPARSLL